MVLFTKRRKITNIRLKIGCNDIPMQKECKSRDVIFDNRLSSMSHGEYVSGKYQKRMGILRHLSAMIWGGYKSCLSTINKIPIGPFIEYLFEAYFPHLNMSRINYKKFKIQLWEFAATRRDAKHFQLEKSVLIQEPPTMLLSVTVDCECENCGTPETIHPILRCSNSAD